MKKSLLTFCCAALMAFPGCGQMNADHATLIARLARSLGADVKVHGTLGPAHFGPSFQADLGARIDLGAQTGTGAVSALHSG